MATTVARGSILKQQLQAQQKDQTICFSSLCTVADPISLAVGGWADSNSLKTASRKRSLSLSVAAASLSSVFVSISLRFRKTKHVLLPISDKQTQGQEKEQQQQQHKRFSGAPSISEKEGP
ncbi:hypothetical protein MRB53_032735 [Persea americana]|uniref:Uncharacterized protein n=1 Tax=Persea americana TaxID=3435 RepID=A0ACC2KT35_PERAE|nr:hypothetical protein MRB53_032735 [Persea americana]